MRKRYIALKRLMTKGTYKYFVIKEGEVESRIKKPVFVRLEASGVLPLRIEQRV